MLDVCFSKTCFSLLSSIYQVCPKFPLERTVTFSVLRVDTDSVQSFSCVRLFVTPWTAAHQASLSITNSQSLLKLMSIELVMPSNHLILCHPLLLLPSLFPSIKVFSNGSVLCIRWRKYLSSSFSISPSSGYSVLILTGLISLLSYRVFSSTTAQTGH